MEPHDIDTISSRLFGVLWPAIDRLPPEDRDAVCIDTSQRMENDALEFVAGRRGFKPSALDAGPARNPAERS